MYIYVHMCVYIYIYIEREREREICAHTHNIIYANARLRVPGELGRGLGAPRRGSAPDALSYVYTYMYVYIYIYIHM